MLFTRIACSPSRFWISKYPESKLKAMKACCLTESGSFFDGVTLSSDLGLKFFTFTLVLISRSISHVVRSLFVGTGAFPIMIHRLFSGKDHPFPWRSPYPASYWSKWIVYALEGSLKNWMLNSFIRFRWYLVSSN